MAERLDEFLDKMWKRFPSFNREHRHGKRSHLPARMATQIQMA
jgi:hypothetical protein